MEFIKIVAGAFYCVKKEKTALFKALFWPFVSMLLIDATDYLELNSTMNFVVGILNICVQTIFAVTVHRIILLGANSISSWGLGSWTLRETLFALYVIGLGLLYSPIILLDVIPVYLTVLILLIVSWLVGRFSLVFPGIAVDKGVTYKLSWQLTKDYQLLMFLIILVFPILLALPVVIIFIFIPKTVFISSLMSAVILVFTISALSVTYQQIIKGKYGEHLDRFW